MLVLMLREEGKKDTFMKYAPGDAEDTYGSNERLYFQRGEDGKVRRGSMIAIHTIHIPGRHYTRP